MKIPLSWLRDYVDFDASAEDLAQRLTFSGTEVEGIEQVGPSFEGIVVGEILSVDPHPSADRLLLCRVGDGKAEHRVVCGATNFAVGDKVPFAPVGATLPNGMKIEKRKLRGELSMGMLCAEDELQISDDHSGLMILPKDTPAGRPLAQVVPAGETVLKVEITWNRPDCLSVMGLAREVAALYGTTLKRPSVDFPELGEPVDALAAVRIEDPVGCPRYTARVITDAKLGPSPVWMQKRLQLCGVRAISNLVDVTNYVMLECGQPLHAFDYTLIVNHEIIVRRARPGESMATLDGVQRALTPEMVLITDPARAVAVAGIMGGAGSEIRDTTQSVLLETATFHPPSIHRTSTALNLITESSHRYERNVDVGGVDWASRRATALILETAGGTAAQGVIDAWPTPPAVRRVRCRYSRARSLLGVDVGSERIVGILKSLELPVVEQDAESCVVDAPTFRPDIEIEADLIEEVARIYGLDNVPDVAPVARVVPDADDARTRAVSALRTRLLGLGLTEIMNYSFTSAKLLDVFTPGEGARRVVLPNPVSADFAIMRDSLIPQLTESLGRNVAHQVPMVSVFEIGKVFLRDGDGRIREKDTLCIGLMGKVGRRGLDLRKPVKDTETFLWLKGLIERVLSLQHIDDASVASCVAPPFEAGRSVEIKAGGARIGLMGLLAKPVRAEWRMAEPVGLAELDLDGLLAGMGRVRPLVPVPVFPSVARDVALVLPVGVSHDEIVKIIQKCAPKELTAVELFDIFTGDAIGVGRKSMAYSLTYRSAERTLTDEEVNSVHESIKGVLRRELNAEIRDR